MVWIRGLFLGVALIAMPITSDAQDLPAQVQADLYLAEIYKLAEKNDYSAVSTKYVQLFQWAKSNPSNVTVENWLYYGYALSLQREERFRESKAQVVGYLQLADRTGQYYYKALATLSALETKIKNSEALDEAAELMILATRHINNGKHELALELSRKARTSMPSGPEFSADTKWIAEQIEALIGYIPLQKSANRLSKQKRPRLAVEKFVEALKYLPDDVYTWARLRHIRGAIVTEDIALGDIAFAAEDWDSARLHYYEAETYAIEGTFEKEAITERLEKFNTAFYHYAMATADSLITRENYLAAYGLYGLALEARPGDALAMDKRTKAIAFMNALQFE